MAFLIEKQEVVVFLKNYFGQSLHKSLLYMLTVQTQREDYWRCFLGAGRRISNLPAYPVSSPSSLLVQTGSVILCEICVAILWSNLIDLYCQ